VLIDITPVARLMATDQLIRVDVQLIEERDGAGSGDHGPERKELMKVLADDNHGESSDRLTSSLRSPLPGSPDCRGGAGRMECCLLIPTGKKPDQ